MGEAFLEVKPASGRPFSFALGPKPVRIGRDPTVSDLVIDDPLLSKLHARLEEKGSDFILVDEGSRNGTFVQGKRAQQKVSVVLKDGDEITLGLTALKFRSGAAGRDSLPVRRFLGTTQEYFKINDLLGASTAAPIPEALMRLLVRLAEEVLPESNSQRLHQSVVDIACESLNAARAATFTQTPEGQLLVIAAHPADATNMDPPDSFFKAVVERRGVVLVRNAQQGPITATSATGERVSLLGVPIWQQSEVSAMLYIESKSDSPPFTEAEAAQGSVIAALVGPATFQVRTIETLEQEKNQLHAQIRSYQRSGNAGAGYLQGNSRSLIKLREQVIAAGEHDAPLIVIGELGTGRESVARGIHAASARREKPFVAALCGGLESEVLARELFGEGLSSKPGLFQLAWGGTLFLDEIGDLPTLVQDRIVKAYTDQTPMPRPRLMASTAQSMQALVQAKRVTEAFSRLLGPVTVVVPPLRERSEDIPILAQHFLKQHASNLNKTASLSPDALASLEAMSFTANLRDLSNVIERAVVLVGSGGVIDQRHLARTVVNEPVKPAGTILLKEAVQDFERSYVLKVLADQHGHRTRTAKVLGLSRQALSEKLRRYGIRDKEDEAELSNATNEPSDE